MDYFTGDGTSTTFQLSRIPASATSILVHIGGVKQVASTTDPAYYLDGSKLVFVSPPGAYSPIEVNYLGIAGQVNIPGVQSITQDMLSLQLANTFVYQTTANGATASFTLNAPPVSANSLVVSANGVVQYDYSVNGSNLTFGFTPPVGTLIRITSLALAQAGVPADGSVTSVKLGANLTLTGNTTATLGGGTINNMAIGGTTPASGAFTTLSASGVATFSAGTVSAPAITTTGDTNTGIFFPAADTIAFTEGGVEAMRIDSDGEVGIGTTNPVSRLHVNASSGSIALFQRNSGTDGALDISFPSQQTTLSSTFSFIVSTASTERMRIDSAGNVGIGTASPSSKFVVSNTGAAGLEINPIGSASAPAIYSYNRNTSAYDILTTVSSEMRFQTGSSPAERMRIDSSGQVYIGTNTAAFGTLNVQRFASAPYATVTIQDNATPANAVGLYLRSNSTTPSGISTAGSPMAFYVGGAGGGEAMRIDSSGNVGIGTSATANAKLTVVASTSGTGGIRVETQFGASYFGGYNNYPAIMYDSSGLKPVIVYDTNNNTNILYTNNAERMRIDSNGVLLVGKTEATITTAGQTVYFGQINGTRVSAQVCTFNRLTDDGVIVDLRQDSTQEGTISVSGTTVSYNGGHLARWSQLPDGSKDDTILKGTVLTNLDDMCVWTKDGEQLPNEQLNKMKVSDVEGDTNVAGVFVNWTRDEDCNSDDMNIAMTGDMIIRIADGVVVQKGDLLMSAGDGTAKPQDDDIVRSKTIAKVTSNYVTCTYADGSYCVPCVLMAC